jgi:DNA-binding transcriptional LysR family regulator
MSASVAVSTFPKSALRTGLLPAGSPIAVPDVRILDLLTILVVRRSGSVSSAARELKVTPSQVSKSITRLERRLGVKLFGRGANGLTLTEAGEALAPTIEEAVETVRLLGRPTEARAPAITLAAPHYLLAQWLPCIVDCLQGHRLRFLEFPPALLRAYATQNVFDIAVLPSSPERITEPWVGTCVGEMRSGLFANARTARKLEPLPVEPDRLRDIPFIMPVAKHQGLLAAVGDDCPLPSSERLSGHEAHSITSALLLAVRTGQLVFGPHVAAARYLESRALVAIPVKGWNVCEPLFVACNGDRVLASVQTALVRTLREALRHMD